MMVSFYAVQKVVKSIQKQPSSSLNWNEIEIKGGGQELTKMMLIY